MVDVVEAAIKSAKRTRDEVEKDVYKPIVKLIARYAVIAERERRIDFKSASISDRAHLYNVMLTINTCIQMIESRGEEIYQEYHRQLKELNGVELAIE